MKAIGVCRMARAARTSSRVAGRSPVADVVGDGGREQDGLLGHDPDVFAQGLGLEVPQVFPVQGDGAVESGS